MTVTLSKAQIEALKVELGKYGLEVRVPTRRKAKAADELSERIARLRAMKFKTASVKVGLLYTLKKAQKYGYGNDIVAAAAARYAMEA